ncbi:hypothetical protein [Streptomyces sp. NPDC057910]|uniref:hypothetical protein n=1 Tax=Streptomyces sp. NPDC057910 TaxID=3346278 RepID=UPI0036E3506E
MIEGQAALRREVREGFDGANTRIDALTEEMRSGNARIIEMLASLKAGQDSNQE